MVNQNMCINKVLIKKQHPNKRHANKQLINSENWSLYCFWLNKKSASTLKSVISLSYLKSQLFAYKNDLLIKLSGTILQEILI